VLPEYVTINGTRHATANLTDAAKAQVLNVQFAEQEISRLQQRLALAQTARNAYLSALLGALKPADAEPEGKPKKARVVRKSKKAEEA